MKNIPLFCFFLLSTFVQNAVAQTDFSKVDNYAKNYRHSGKNLNQLADELARPFATETEKARAFFVWIADNIAYDYKTSMNPKNIRITYRTEEEHQRKLAQLRKKQLDRTLRLRKGICEDYSQLFKTMCERVGIESKIIIGHARNNPAEIGRAPRASDHAWNAVNLEGSWYLLDATWGAGTVDHKGKFLKDIRTEYFKVLPADLIKSHFPEEEDLQFLPTPLSRSDFGNSPLAGFGYLKFGVTSHFPEKGIINSRSAEKIRFKLNFSDKIDGKLVLFENNKGEEIIYKQQGDEITFDYFLKNKRGKTLTIAVVQNRDVLEVLSYKVR